MHNVNKGIVDYYAQRAEEYDRVYQKPERQEDIASLRVTLKDLFVSHNVLEIACGTGFWTLPLAGAAQSITSTDVNEEVLAIARERTYSNCQPVFLKADAYGLSNISSDFSAAFAGFWLSHVPRQRISIFLNHLHSKLQDDALVVFLDNNYVEGSNNPMSDYVDSEGNTYSQRRLSDGSCWEIIKNFPNEQELRQLVADVAYDVNYHTLTYYWMLSYRIRK